MKAKIRGHGEQPAEYADIDWDGLTQARKALTTNPFEVTSEDGGLARAEAWFARNDEHVGRALIALLASVRARDAKKVALAAAHAQARRGAPPNEQRSLETAVSTAREQGLPMNPSGFIRLSAALRRHYAALGNLIGTSSAMTRIRRELWTLSFGKDLVDSLSIEPDLRRTHVLILGETGTGKELVAEVLQASAFTNPSPPFQAINCAALPGPLAESEFLWLPAGGALRRDSIQRGATRCRRHGDSLP